MKGLMQDWPLLVHRVLDHAARWHGEAEVVSRSIEGPIHRYCYSDLDHRARALASAAKKSLKAKKGSIVATMAWNTNRHLEIWYGLMSLGAVVHTLNPRLFADQLAYIVNHAGDEWIFADLTFVPLLEKLQDRLPQVKGFVVMTDRAHMPAETALRNALCYEELIATGNPDFTWPKLDENTACGLCYTSGTTGNPKGVVYSHRSNVLHAMSTCAADAMAIASRDTVMPVVPMFHANAWSLAIAGPMAGARLVMPGARLDGPSLYELLDQEKVTFAAAVPTVWMTLLQYLEQNPALALPALERVLIGGSACPEAMMRIFGEKYGADVLHAWGMTEMSPIGSICTRKGSLAAMPDKEWWPYKLKQGRPQFTVDMKIAGDDGAALAHDGKTFGRLKVRGPAVAGRYYKTNRNESFDEEGWFDTGDVATIDRYGYMAITDRSKDVIKSGGEWISSIDLENVAVACPGVAEAAAIGIAHPKWDERPLLIVVRKPQSQVSKEDVRAFMTGKIAKWWLPDDIVFAEAIPHTATGKISKLALRETYKNYTWPSAS